MLAIERKNAILERLQKEQRVLVAELSQEYGVTEETIRRDLDKLEKEGFTHLPDYRVVTLLKNRLYI